MLTRTSHRKNIYEIVLNSVPSSRYIVVFFPRHVIFSSNKMTFDAFLLFVVFYFRHIFGLGPYVKSFVYFTYFGTGMEVYPSTCFCNLRFSLRKYASCITSFPGAGCALFRVYVLSTGERVRGVCV